MCFRIKTSCLLLKSPAKKRRPHLNWIRSIKKRALFLALSSFICFLSSASAYSFPGAAPRATSSSVTWRSKSARNNPKCVTLTSRIRPPSGATGSFPSIPSKSPASSKSRPKSRPPPGSPPSSRSKLTLSLYLSYCIKFYSYMRLNFSYMYFKRSSYYFSLNRRTPMS